MVDGDLHDAAVLVMAFSRTTSNGLIRTCEDEEPQGQLWTDLRAISGIYILYFNTHLALLSSHFHNECLIRTTARMDSRKTEGLAERRLRPVP